MWGGLPVMIKVTGPGPGQGRGGAGAGAGPGPGRGGGDPGGFAAQLGRGGRLLGGGGVGGACKGGKAD